MKISTVILTLGSFLLGATGFANKPLSATDFASKQKPTTFLFSVSAGKGKIEKNPVTGEYMLSMQVSDKKQVLMFSDRPYRIVKYISGKELKQLWSQGSNNFKQDPPNAVLSSHNNEPRIIILKSVHVNGDTISYRFTTDKLFNIKTGNIQKVVLTIDEQKLYSCSSSASC